MCYHFVSNPVTHSSKGWLLGKEVTVLTIDWWVQFGIEEEAPIGNSLEGSRALVGEPQPHK